MKRCPQLEALSDEHHSALVLARTVSRCAAGRGNFSVAQAWDQVEKAFANELDPHFCVEEKFMIPPLEKKSLPEIDEMLARFHREHRELRECIRNTQKRDAESLARFAELLHDHVRFEERTLFNAAEENLSQEELDLILEVHPRRPQEGLVSQVTQK